MNQFKLLNMKDFVFVGYKYDDQSLISRTALHKRRRKLRVYYYLPNGQCFYFNSVPDLQSKKEKDAYIAEFRYVLQTGFVPNNGSNELRKNSYDPKDGRFSIFFPKYFSDYSVGARVKGASALKTQKSISENIVKYFESIGIFSITEITNEHIDVWDKSLKHTKKKRGKGVLSPATRNAWRKVFRAFLNTAKDKGYALRCDPEKMNIYEYDKGGKIDPKADVRRVIYPLKLIEAVEQCSFIIDTEKMPDLRKIIRSWRETGPRPGEMQSLSTHNLVYENGKVIGLKILDLPDCPHEEDEIGFRPKNFKSYRTIPISGESAAYIESLDNKFKNVKRYGWHKGKLVEFPFLFVFWDEKEKCYVRDDRKFDKLFHDITTHALQEFKLPYKDAYITYDLRRSCNQFLKTIAKFDEKEAAHFLGHSVATNRKHYTLDEDGMDISNAQMERSIIMAAKTSPEIAKMYANLLGGPSQATGTKEDTRPQPKYEIELETVKESLSSLQSSGFVVMKREDDDELTFSKITG